MTVSKRTLAGIGVAILLVVTACQSSAEETGSSETTVAEQEASSTTTGAESSGGDSTTSTEATTTTTPVIVEEFDLYLPDLKIPEIVQETSVEGAGGRPLFEWDAADGADSYELTVFGSGGTMYWAWRGSDTSVYLGGAPASDNSPGPRIVEGMSWAVVALDTSGEMLAQSRIRPIAP